MSDQPESTEDSRDGAARQERAEGALWFGVPGMAWALLFSVGLHALVLLPFLLGVITPRMDGFDAEWVERMEELRGIGHGRQPERWAQLEDRGEPEAIAEEQVEQVAEIDLAQADEAEDVEQTPPEPEPEPEPEAAVVEKPAPKPAPEEQVPKKDDAPPKTPPAEKAAAPRSPFDPQKPMPGVERGGPTAIPSLRNYGPGNARVTALVRLDRVRGTLYADAVRQIMQKVPDFRILAAHTGLDPIGDLDAFFMASARPQYIQESFLAVRHSMSEAEIKDVLDRRFREPIPWQVSGGAPMRPLVSVTSGYQDPRRVLLARPGLAVVGKDVWLDEIAENLAADSPLRAGEDASSQTAPATMLDGLAQIERVADAEDTLVLLSAYGLVYTLPGLGRMHFEGVSLKVSNPASPTTNVDLKFKDAAEATRFANSCPALKGRLKKGLGLDGLAGMAARAVGLGDVIDKVKCRAEGEYVNINVVVTAQQLRTLAGFAAPLMPNPRVLNRLPPPPLPPAPEPVGDAQADVGVRSEEDVGQRDGSEL